jgi:hypothetical protein
MAHHGRVSLSGLEYAGCDHAVKAQAAMLESQLARVHQTLVISDEMSSDNELLLSDRFPGWGVTSGVATGKRQ